MVGGGTPSSHGGEVPHPVMVGGTQGTPHHPDLAGVPPPREVWTDKQTENSTFPHPSDAGDKKCGYTPVSL